MPCEMFFNGPFCLLITTITVVSRPMLSVRLPFAAVKLNVSMKNVTKLSTKCKLS